VTTTLLQLENVSVRFGALSAVDGVSLNLREGERRAVIGPNGAGKTTLFNVIAGIQPATYGAVFLEGEDITRLGAHQRARRGLSRTFQRLEVFGTLTVRENLLVAAESRRRWDRSVKPAAVVDDLIERLGLGPVIAKDADSLPTGTQRLVELARALATGPRVVLLDEASSGVSTFETAAMSSLLRDLAAGGLTVVLVEHDMEFVMGLCDRVAMLDHGVLVADGSPAEVQLNPAVQAAYLGTGVG